MSYIDEMLAKLTSNYNNDPNGNIGKLFTLPADQMEELKSVFTDILNSRDIDQITGAGLDRIGVNLRQSRGNLNDDLYRVLLKTKTVANLSKGDINTILQVMAIIFTTDITNVGLTPQYPAALFGTVMMDSINPSLLTSFESVVNFLREVTASGVDLNIAGLNKLDFSSHFGGLITTSDMSTALLLPITWTVRDGHNFTWEQLDALNLNWMQTEYYGEM